MGVVHSSPPAAESGPTRTAADDRLSVELTSVVAGARRRALRDGDRHIDTAHLLHSLLETDPAVSALFDGGQVARLLGYLVQRSIGYGLQWQGAVEDSGAMPVVREAAGWSPAAAGAMEAALVRAGARGARQVGGVDLLVTLAQDPECRAVEVLGRAGVDPAALVAAVTAAAD
ncbi:Clp protease N-terminal domain-containing protein [Streptomyces sp. B-S-A8]|uniref:Clp protease N-terminal domain-containing protein n=1 Tax=Streptomyces solicavernae TaxID=3043614 RepID=A0ABT6RVB5_9ACTN|nr:Clp protease N-terminal domain-containing protein [Streptomyces sp. B-S-A8]MDI3388119.1 Clp protease N-terminal domain-containing protein [Streptomyces sp. B-S-A8]